MKKKILIFTASMGSGHLTASQGIHDKYVQKGYEVEIIDVLPWTIFGRFSRWSFWVLAQYAHWILEYIFYTSSRVSPSWIDRFFYSLWTPQKKLASWFQNDSIEKIWTTFPALSLTIENYWNQEIHVQITDYTTPHLSWTWGKNIIIHTLDEESKQYIQKENKKSKVRVGSFPLPSKFLEASKISDAQKLKIRHTKNIPEKTPIFLFFFHHILFGNEHTFIQQFLSSQKYENYIGIIIAGNNHAMFKTITNHRIRIEQWVSNIHEYYAIASGVCGKCGGAFISESMLFGLPICVSGVLSGQEKGNKAFLEKYYTKNIISFPA